MEAFSKRSLKSLLPGVNALLLKTSGIENDVPMNADESGSMTTMRMVTTEMSVVNIGRMISVVGDLFAIITVFDAEEWFVYINLCKLWKPSFLRPYWLQMPLITIASFLLHFFLDIEINTHFT